MAMVSVGLGWPLCLIVTPLLLGWLADMQGLKFTFVVTELFLLLVAGGSYLWHLKVRRKATLRLRVIR